MNHDSKMQWLRLPRPHDGVVTSNAQPEHWRPCHHFASDDRSLMFILRRIQCPESLSNVGLITVLESNPVNNSTYFLTAQ